MFAGSWTSGERSPVSDNLPKHRVLHLQQNPRCHCTLCPCHGLVADDFGAQFLRHASNCGSAMLGSLPEVEAAIGKKGMLYAAELNWRNLQTAPRAYSFKLVFCKQRYEPIQDEDFTNCPGQFSCSLRSHENNFGLPEPWLEGSHLVLTP